MDFVSVIRALFWFFFGVALVAVPMFAFAAELPVIVPGVTYSPPVSGNIYISPSSISGSGPVTINYPSSTINSPIRVPLPPVAGVPAGNQLINIPTTITPNVARVAGAVVSLARVSGPVGLGLSLLPILCAETKICQSLTSPNEFQKPVLNGGLYKKDSSLTTYASPDEVCASLGTPYGGQTHYVNTAPIYQLPNSLADPSINLVQVIGRCDNSVGSYATVQYKNGTGTLANAPPTETDWGAAAASLAAAVGKLAQIVQALQDMKQPVPVDKPELAPTSATSDPTSTVNRDSAGNVTNITTITTTTNIAPVTNNSTINTVNITQITNTTTTGPSGAVITTSSTSAKPPEPDDPEIDFDKVPDLNLEKQELPLQMAAPSSWGEGSCPPDPSVSVMGHPIAVPVHVVCDYMVGVRGAVIALFALISAYIVIGVKFEG